MQEERPGISAVSFSLRFKFSKIRRVTGALAGDDRRAGGGQPSFAVVDLNDQKNSQPNAMQKEPLSVLEFALEFTAERHAKRTPQLVLAFESWLSPVDSRPQVPRKLVVPR